MAWLGLLIWYQFLGQEFSSCACLTLGLKSLVRALASWSINVTCPLSMDLNKTSVGSWTEVPSSNCSELARWLSTYNVEVPGSNSRLELEEGCKWTKKSDDIGNQYTIFQPASQGQRNASPSSGSIIDTKDFQYGKSDICTLTKEPQSHSLSLPASFSYIQASLVKDKEPHISISWLFIFFATPLKTYTEKTYSYMCMGMGLP